MSLGRLYCTVSHSMSNGPDETDDPDVTAGPANGGLRIELWTRHPVSESETVVDRLRRLRSEGVLTTFSVETWPEEVPISEGGGGDVLTTIDRFESWADDHEVSLRPPIESRTASLLVGGDERVLVTPKRLVAVYDDGNLAGVYPCTRDGLTWTVTDLLNALDPETDGSPDGDPGRPGITAT